MTTLSAPLVIPLQEVFSTNEDGGLTFEVIVNTEGIVEAEIINDTLYVTPIRAGSVRVRTIARDNEDDTATDTFRLDVRQNNPPQITQEVPVRDQVLVQGSSPFTLNLLSIFNDPDGDPLVFSTTSSNQVVSFPTIDRGVLTAQPLQPGTTLISVFADDQFGGQNAIQFELEVLKPYPSQISAGFTVAFGSIRSSSSYRLIALPGEQYPRIEDTAPGLPGEDWITFAADPDIEGALISYDSTDTFRLRPGRGLWFLGIDPWEIEDEPVATVQLTPGGTYEIPLHDGWNIISNPFDIDLVWEDVTAWNNTSQALWGWEGSYASVDTFYTSTRRGEAFYYYNAEERTHLDLPYPGLANPFLSKTALKSAEPSLVQLTAINGQEYKARVEAGFSPDANEGSDSFDYYAPPSVFGDIAFTIQNEHPSVEGRSLARDILPSSQPLKRYHLELRSASGMPVQLFASLDDEVRSSRVLLINEHDGTSYDLSTTSSVWLTPEKSTTPFTLLIGDASSVEREALDIKPSLYTLKQNYPNPFNASTTIEFSLPTTQQVRLHVFDSMGRLVDTLIENTLEAGHHRVSWDGFNGRHERLANGVYYYRLSGDNLSLSRTLVILK